MNCREKNKTKIISKATKLKVNLSSLVMKAKILYLFRIIYILIYVLNYA